MVTPALVREAAPRFNEATVVVQRGAAHFPWIDDPAAFSAAIRPFLDGPPADGPPGKRR
jgi:pimeloyl-ACP methyl ester carboxylesterase